MLKIYICSPSLKTKYTCLLMYMYLDDDICMYMYIYWKMYICECEYNYSFLTNIPLFCLSSIYLSEFLALSKY